MGGSMKFPCPSIVITELEQVLVIAFTQVHSNMIFEQVMLHMHVFVHPS